MTLLLTPAQMMQADRLTIAGGTPGIDLMERAGRAVAEAALRLVPPGRPILVLCGPGNNGGDGYVAARILRDWGFSLTLYALIGPERLSGDARLAADRFHAPIVRDAPDPAAFGLIIDALFGGGLTRDLDAEVQALVGAVNASGSAVLAVDLPSGIDGATGLVRGTAINARHTVTFAAARPGHVLLPGRTHCGTVHVADIGISAATLAASGANTHWNTPPLWQSALRPPQIDDHKYRRGAALIVSGAMPQTGAARLAAHAALRVGAGLVTLAAPRETVATHAARLDAVMIAPCDTPDELAGVLDARRIRAVGIGPGLAPDRSARQQVRAVLEHAPAIVLDAGAITAFAGDVDALARLIRRRPDRPVVITPHDGELARLFGEGAAALNSPCRLERARAAAAQSGAIVVAKGPDCVIAMPDGRAAITSNATPDLATAGSGDLLTGMIVGMLAQGMPPFEAVAAAVWMHGEVGSAFGRGFTADDGPAVMSYLLRTLQGGAIGGQQAP